MQAATDAKSKIFTDVVSTQPLPVLVQTKNNRILGSFHVRADWRLKDEINEQESFIALTEVEVYDHSGLRIFRSEFMVIHQDSIEWIVPQAEMDADSPVMKDAAND